MEPLDPQLNVYSIFTYMDLLSCTGWVMKLHEEMKRAMSDIERIRGCVSSYRVS